jgi:1,4-dihydroxy-2-naphthoate octaprenyltransferase
MNTTTQPLWARALATVPKVTPEEFKQQSVFTKWLIVTRAGVLIMTFFSSAIAGIFAFRYSEFNFLLWILVTIGLCLAHATNNLLNDWIDWRKGIDTDDYVRLQYGSHPMVLLSKQQMLHYVLFTGLSALSVGLYLIYLRGAIVLYLTLSGAFFVLFYTYPLKYLGLGELSVLAVWGPLMIGGAVSAMGGTWHAELLWLALPASLGPTAVLFGKHIDKIEKDSAKGVWTLPAILGFNLSRKVAILMMIAQYAVVFVQIWQGYYRWWTLGIVSSAAPALLRTIKIFNADRPKERPQEIPTEIWPLYYVAYAFSHNKVFSAMYVLGLCLDTVYLCIM